MDKKKRNLLEGWIEKASCQLRVAEDHLKSYIRYSEAVQAAQECIELSVKSILSIFGINYALTHGWDESKKQFAEIASQIDEKHILEKLSKEYLDHIRLPRLIMLVNFWSQFYLTAKYGFSTSNLSPAKDLFDKKEAELAVEHAKECYDAASLLIHLPKEQLRKIE